MTTAALLEQHRAALTSHRYRMLGSVVDAEDAVQEAMLRAWKGLDRFREQASVKTWLYRIASMTSYLDVETLLPRFGMAMRLE